MDLDRGTLARLDRRLLAGLGQDERFQMVRVLVMAAKWATWKRYWRHGSGSMGSLDCMRARDGYLTVVLLVAAFTLLSAGCGDTDTADPVVIQFDDEDVRLATGIWVNQLGLNQTDVEVWRNRLGLACNDGVWLEEVARRHAAQFIAADLPDSIRAETMGAPTVGEGANALWIMAVQVCRDAFPPGAIEAGPP